MAYQIDINFGICWLEYIKDSNPHLSQQAGQPESPRYFSERCVYLMPKKTG
jgi:hypothetical protein